MGFAARHPRYTIALIVLFFVTVLFFANSDSSSTYLSRPYPLAFHKQADTLPPHPGNVDDQIRASEMYYQESLKERQKLITKWGPSPSQVDAFPSNGEFYTLCKSAPANTLLTSLIDFFSLCRGLFYPSLSMPAPDAAYWYSW
jgi:hypothetical protein